MGEGDPGAAPEAGGRKTLRPIPPPDPGEVERFMRHVDRLPSGCHFWTGCWSRGKGNRKWYGTFTYSSAGVRVRVRAHRFACEAVGGRPPLPPGHHRDHTCCFSLCVNEQCIEYVTHEENQRRKVERRRLAQGAESE